jgi:type IV secretory pathway VirJ component
MKGWQGRRLLLAGLAVTALAAGSSAARAETVPGGRYGEIQLTRPSGALRGFVVLFSGRTGWSADDEQAAEALARNGAMVAGVDLPRYASALAASAQKCHALTGDAEDLSHQLQRDSDSNQYFSPILAGTGEGALLAERMLAQAPDNTIAGAVAIDPDTADAEPQRGTAGLPRNRSDGGPTRSCRCSGPGRPCRDSPARYRRDRGRQSRRLDGTPFAAAR